MRAAGRVAPAQLGGRPVVLRGEHVGRRIEDRAQLGVAVSLALDGLGVEPERHVVHEHAAVDLGEVDPALPTVDERVERAHDIVPVDAEVEREVVAGTRWDAGERQIVLGGDRGHQRLGSVTAGGRQSVGSPGHRVADELYEIVAGLQLDRLDPTCPRLVGEVVAHGLAAARTGVPHHDRAPRWNGGLDHRVGPEHPPGDRDAQDQERDGRKTEAEAVARKHDDDRREKQHPPLAARTCLAGAFRRSACHATTTPAASSATATRPRGRSRTISIAAATIAATRQTNAAAAETRRPTIASPPSRRPSSRAEARAS